MPRARTRVLALAVLPLVLAACGQGEPSSAPTTTSAAPSASATTPSSTPTPTGTAVRVPVYWVGDTRRGPLLYREFLDGTAPAGDAGRALAALDLMLQGRPLDPDYRSLWPRAVQVVSVTVDGDTAAVDLTGPVTRQVRTADSPDVQQLVHTVTAALDGVETVTLSVDGTELVPGPVARSPQVEVLAPVWIIDPQEGASLAGPLRVSGAATVFEATVSWEVLQDGSVVRSGFTTASTGAPGRGTWTLVVRGLPPGTYQVAAWETSMKDGSRQYLDDKTVELG
jgi:hypothetical protein